jgi:N-carbamoylputrescine amidase
MKELIVGLVQHAVDDTRELTIARSVAGIRDASVRGAKLVVLQELYCGPYF